ncbi:hypothetical protein D9M71_253800 [compost metagenome]
MVLGRVWQDLMGNQANNGRVDLWRWVECPWSDIEQVFDPAMVLDHDRQAPPVTTPRAGSQALDHFLLQHEMHVTN